MYLTDAKSDEDLTSPAKRVSGDSAPANSSSSSAGETEEEELDCKTPEGETPAERGSKDSSQMVVFI